MFIFSKKPNAPKQETVPADTGNIVKVEKAEPTLNETVSVPPSLPQVNMFGKFRNKGFGSGQDTSYENETWAPEYEPVGLFRKRRANVEGQVSSSSGPQ
ncbi:MAG: hypothetical protein M0T74_03730 [Desulfitobacterium hafniense]|nr:hypothetical protein [Desulfitobacterium hafniense]